MNDHLIFEYSYLFITFLAPTTHAPASHRNESYSSSDTRQHDSGIESTGLSERKISGNRREFTDDNNYGEQPGHVTDNKVLEQDSPELNHKYRQRLEDVESLANKIGDRSEFNQILSVDDVINIEGTDVMDESNKELMEVNTVEQENYNYDQTELQETDYPPTPYDDSQQNEHIHDENQSGYQNEYEQNYGEPTYAEGEFPNYDQYPHQFNNPNTQYEEQYDYTTDNNYQTEQTYEQPQHIVDSEQLRDHQDIVHSSVEMKNNDSENIEANQS